MRYLFLNLVFLLLVSPAISQDTLPRFRDNLVVINYRALPSYAHYEKRYDVLKNYLDDYRYLEINHFSQSLIRSSNYGDSTILSAYGLLNRSQEHFPYEPTDEKELFYAAWRNELTRSKNTNDIESAITEGTKTLIDLGYTDLGSDFMPFISGVLEEHHLVNYDGTRTKAFGKGSRGVVTSLQILKALDAIDTEQNYGVCRDVHETGRELLKTMAETWYGHFYPDSKIEFDDYIFLQSWVTNKSHHVTVSLIDPLNTGRVYEIDWGRVISKWKNAGYNNGRLYGNTYRIWKFDKAKQMTVPVDYRRTHFGKILDENILSQSEYTRFNGIYDEEFYSDIRYTKDLGKYGGASFSVGAYNPSQHYALAGWYLETRKKGIAGIMDHSYVIALQAALHEDTRKKQLMFSHLPWESAASIMAVPRVISKFETRKFRINDKFSLVGFLNQQFDIFFIWNRFLLDDDSEKKDFSTSGDGNISFSNGISLTHQTNGFVNSLTIQARSSLMPKEIRLFSPNIFTLIPNLRFITPSIDAIASGFADITDDVRVSYNGMFEFTSLGAVMFAGNASARFNVNDNVAFEASAGVTDQLKGIEYFWYPSSKKWMDLGISISGNSLSFSLLKYPESNVSCNISFRKILK